MLRQYASKLHSIHPTPRLRCFTPLRNASKKRPSPVCQYNQYRYKSDNKTDLASAEVIGRDINKSASSSNPELQARPADAFFEDVMAGGPRPPIQIDAVLKDSRGFQLSNGLEVDCGVMVLNGEALLWKPEVKVDRSGIMTISLTSFGALEVSMAKPDMLLIGTGKRNEFVSKTVRDYLHGLGIQVDIMDTRNAASTFNVLAAEGRSVSAALLPAA